jgi:hypothetical protein
MIGQIDLRKGPRIVCMAFGGHAIAPGILTLPVLADCFCRIIQLLAICTQVINSMELKNVTAFGFSLPNARSFPALTRIQHHQLWLHVALRILLPILLPIVQRRHGNFGVLRAGTMHRLSVMA